MSTIAQDKIDFYRHAGVDSEDRERDRASDVEARADRPRARRGRHKDYI